MNRIRPSRSRWNSSGDRLFDLEDHLGFREHGVGIGNDRGPGAFEFGIGDARSDPGALARSARSGRGTTSSRTPAGVIATRYSLSLSSRGTPTFIGIAPA